LRHFGGCSVETFLAEIDFFVYFTNPNWRESFGRVIAEAIAAGKLVVTDPGTASSFGSAVVASDGGDVDAIVQGFCAEPHRYVHFVEAAQAELARFRPAVVVQRILAQINSFEAGHDALV
jgi:glycosyltransferase involved in cell wall biosynthesis